jgi:tetratricopeptide (TPR) repeat protein
MPKLPPLQWLIVGLFQVFYGFAVFALTRDYYQRRPGPATPVAATNPHVDTSRAATSPVLDRFGSGSAIPESVVQRDPVLLAQLGDERLRAGRYPEAIGVYRRVLQLKPDDVDTFNDLGLALYYSGDSAQALTVLQQGTQVNPAFQRIWLTLGFVRMKSGDAAGSATALQRAVELGADNRVGQEAQRMLDSLGRP